MRKGLFVIAATLAFAAHAQDSTGVVRDSTMEKARAFFAQVYYDSCLIWLDKAAQSPAAPNLEIAWYKGRCLGYQGHYSKALTELNKYDQLEGPDSIRVRMKAATYYFRDKVFEQIAAQAAANESTSVARKDSAVAVIYFQNAGGDSSLDPLQKGLAEMLITDLSQVSAIKVVERTQLQKMIQEIELDMAGLTDNENRVRVAQLLGASRVVGGMFRSTPEGDLQIRAGVIEIATKDIKKIESLSGPLKNIFSIEKELAFALIEEMGILITDEERVRIQKIRTENLLAFMAYARGMDAQDNGDFIKAREHFAEAAQLDPEFNEAAKMVEAMELFIETPKEPALASEEQEIETAPVAFEGSGPITESQEDDRVTDAGPTLTSRMATMTGAAFMSELGVSEATSHNDEPGQGVLGKYERADYADFKDLGLQNKKKVNIKVLLPQQ